jgi:hypothetical protein
VSSWLTALGGADPVRHNYHYARTIRGRWGMRDRSASPETIQVQPPPPTRVDCTCTSEPPPAARVHAPQPSFYDTPIAIP